MAPTRPILVIHPRTDVTFVATVKSLIEDGVDTPAALAAALRPRWPSIVVRDRGLSSEPTAMWYVYRDGAWTP